MISQSTLAYKPVPRMGQYVNKTEEKIEEIRDLLPGWRYGQGVKFSDEVLEIALELNIAAKGLLVFETDVFPSEGGDILLTVYYGDYHLELMINRNAMIDISINEDDDEIEYIENQEIEQVKEAIKEFRKLVWKRSDSFTREITTGERDVFKVPHLPILATVPASPYLTKSVQKEKLVTSANILSDTILPQQQSLSSIGASTPHCFLGVAS